MNPSSSRTMLVVDKSTTQMGDIVNEWLRENHGESPGAGKVFLMFINEGMTSVQQVADIGINFILKKAIKGRYQVFRDSAVDGLSISELAGSVITVPREDLFEMVETRHQYREQAPQVDRRHIRTVRSGSLVGRHECI
ncbi:hypothetical protein MHU86_10034 [Fragilaria crotonensis]|nr:hypothetical protein MHU86_10034 [Fragilaria crotonensis]